MEKLIMVALKFKANLRSSMSGLLTSSVEWCGLMATKESRWHHEGMEEWLHEKSLLVEMKITSANRFLYSPIPKNPCLLSVERHSVFMYIQIVSVDFHRPF